jgi:DNA/RNA-binding protein KIN17
MHTQSESHTRRALSAATNFKGVQEDFSKAFLRDFVSLLKTGHREKAVHVNKFYQEYIANKEAVHMNATKWSNLTEFAKYLGREGICRVEERDDGFYIAWIDDSPEALKRREALRRKEMQDKGDEEREQMLLMEQIRRARREKGHSEEGGVEKEEEEKARELVRQEGEKIKLSFGAKPAVKTPPKEAVAGKDDEQSAAEGTTAEGTNDAITKMEVPKQESPAPAPAAAPKPVSLKFGAKPAPKNVFKNAFAGAPKKAFVEPPKRMSEAERIMKEEMERKRSRDAHGSGFPPAKKPKF